MNWTNEQKMAILKAAGGAVEAAGELVKISTPETTGALGPLIGDLLKSAQDGIGLLQQPTSPPPPAGGAGAANVSRR